MDQRDAADILLFDGFRFDRRCGGCLFRLDQAGAAAPVPLRGRGLALLGLLLQRHGELFKRRDAGGVAGTGGREWQRPDWKFAWTPM